MKILVSTCLIFSFLGFSDSFCPRGGFGNTQPQFGPGCIYRCHCNGDGQCDYVTGECPGGCAPGWMGPGCQYGDIAYNKHVQQLSYGSNMLIDGRNATDGLIATCIGPTTWMKVDLNATYRISGLVVNLSNGVALQGFEVLVGNSSFDKPSDIAQTCFKQNTTEQFNTEIHVVCTTDIEGRYVAMRTLDNATRTTICDIRMYGGRSLAYGRNASQSSTIMTDHFGEGVASRALDGNAATNFASASCTHTAVETSTWWRVNLELVYDIKRIVLYGRQEDCCLERLTGFSVSFSTNNTFSLVFKYPEETPKVITELTTLSHSLAEHVEISLMNRTIATPLTLCEVFVFGDCQNNECGWTCDTKCYCDGPIDKENKIHAKCPGSCTTGWWGYSCNNTCDKNCIGNTCNQSDGHCIECVRGKWGHLCESNCTHCFNGTGCGISNGICTVGCLPGLFGALCSEHCVHCAGDGSCNRSTGVCILGCQPGWQNENCSVACSQGRYGINCSNECGNCANMTCDSINGTCPLGCSEGYRGIGCFEPCSQGRYGINCSNTCGTCANVTCDSINGTCYLGCSEGYSGIGCFDPCSMGRYGINCSNECGNCANMTCDFINGTCPLGCSEGYSGIGCFERLQRDKTTTESVLPIGVPVGGSIGAAGLIIMIILVAIILWKRRNGSLLAKKYQSKQSDPSTSGSQLSSNIYENAAALGLEEERSVMKPENKDSFFKIYMEREKPAGKAGEAGKRIDRQLCRNAEADTEVVVESDNEETLGNGDEGDQQNAYYNFGRNSKRGGKKIAVQDLSEYIKRGIHRSNCIEEEFKTLLSGPQHEMSIALKPRNRQKNRYKGMYAYDKNRVILEPLSDDPDTDYINASFINGYKREKAYIAAQGTISANVTDFWRMIWQYDIQQIVMLTGLIEQGKQKCLQYWPNEGIHEYGMIRVELIDEDICAEYVIRSLLLSKAGSKKQKTVNQFHFTSWPDRGVPDTASSLVEFWNKVRHSECAFDSPILVHCSAGIGRTGTYIALDYIFDEGSEEGYVNIFECINKLREQRVGLVQTMDQYVYLHEAILEAFRDIGNYVSVDDFKHHYEQMQHIDPGTKKTKLLTEFENLQEDDRFNFKRNGMGVTKGKRSDPKDEFMDGKLPENKTKNRCNNILPSERYRPYLSTFVPGRNDYINAVFLPTRKNGRGLLVTQMPLPDTVIDFWRLVYDYEVQSIVMLNEANMPGEAVGVYWPKNEETFRHGTFVVTITSNVAKGSHIERMLQVSKHGEERTLSLKQFACSVWRLNDAVPKSIDGFVNLIDDVQDWKRQSGERPILVHCMNGAERSGLFCVLWCALEKLKSDREVAIRSIVRQMRIRRQHIIPNFEQYKFCHDVIFYSLDKSITYTNI